MIDYFNAIVIPVLSEEEKKMNIVKQECFVYIHVILKNKFKVHV